MRVLTATCLLILTFCSLIPSSEQQARKLSCYKCMSVGKDAQDDCDDPWDKDRRQYRRDCPVGERCVKMTGNNRNGLDVMVRDCYKTNYAARKDGYRNRSLSYYNDKIDGYLYVCNSNYCNGADAMPRRGLVQVVGLAVVAFIARAVISLVA